MTNPFKYLVVINPKAGKRQAMKDWPMISRLLKKYKIEFEYVLTERKLHAPEIAREYINKGFNAFIVIGGDGTLNELVNGIFNHNDTVTREITVGIIPVGTGNDWGRTFGIKNSYEDSIQAIANRKTLLQDVGKCSYQLGNKTKTRYFINVAGLGFDADVARRVNHDKDNDKNNTILYLKNLVLGLLKSKYFQYKITIDDKQLEEKIFSMSVGIGKYNGGGMMQLPAAIPDDGLFDLTLIGDLTKLDVVRNIKNLYDGSFIKHRKIKTYTGKKIIIDTPSPVFLETDGESLGCGPFVFDIIPKSLNVITGF